MRAGIAGALVIAGVVASCVPVGTGGGGGFGPNYASATQIQQAVTNFSVVGSLAGGGSYCEYHSPNFQLIGRDTQPYTGSWSLSGNQICYSYPQGGSSCQNAEIVGNNITFYDNAGNFLAGGNLVGGNVC